MSDGTPKETGQPANRDAAAARPQPDQRRRELADSLRGAAGTDRASGALKHLADGDTDTGLPKGVHVEIKGSFKGIDMTHEGAVDYVREYLANTRERLLALPSHEDGLNMERVHAYRESRGIPQKEILFLSPEDFTQALALAGEEEINEDGRYLPIYDVIIVKRDPDKEALNGGSEFTESMAVHEIAHSDEDNRVIRVEVIPKKRMMRQDEVHFEFVTERSGFIEDLEDGEETGNMQEEGYAEFERGKYMVEELGKSDGFAGRFKPEKANRLDKYSQWKRKSRKDSTVVKGITRSATSAAVYEILDELDPELIPAMHRARNSDSDTAQTEVAQRMNAISPGLYEETRGVDINTDEGYVQTADIYEKVNEILKARNGSQPDAGTTTDQTT